MKLSFCMLTFNDEDCIDMSLPSALKHGDEVIIVDGGSTDKTVSIIECFIKDNPGKIKLIDGPKVSPGAYEDKIFDKYGRCLQNGSFGEMKDIARINATGDYIFFLDSDECLSDNSREVIDFTVSNNKEIDAFNVQYVHFIHDFAHIDNSESWHNGLFRLHKNDKNFTYKGNYNHSTLGGMKKVGTVFNVLIFHLGYAKNMFDVYKRYKRNMIYSEIHMGINQCFWRDWHYYGFPKTKLPSKKGGDFLLGSAGYNPDVVFPDVLVKRFEMDVYNNTKMGSFNPKEALR